MLCNFNALDDLCSSNEKISPLHHAMFSDFAGIHYVHLARAFFQKEM